MPDFATFIFGLAGYNVPVDPLIVYSIGLSILFGESDWNTVSGIYLIMAKKEEIDPDTLALLEWCTEVESFLVAAGASLREAQGYIEEQAEWFTDQFYEGLTPEQAAKASLNEP